VTTPKRPGSKYGEMPPIAGAARAPLPLVTQPMIPLDPSAEAMDPGATRVDNPLQTLKPESAAVLFGRTTTAIAPSGPRTLAPGAEPPKIDLTQHHLPENEEPDQRLSLLLDPDSERSAAFRVLRHHLLEIGRPQCVVVSSPRRHEGKTTVAMNLALALAECGRAKVLLCETHVRHPQLSNAFAFVPPWCFAEQLAAHRNQPMLPWSLVDIPGLWLHVAAINPRIEKTQLLDGPAFAIAVERLRLAGYEHIVVDAPPVLGSADVNLMADAADCVVLALRARTSTTRDLRKAVDQIGAGRVAGTVLVQ
jgi:Mrp family chromosome partitioning ATPase